MDEKDKTPTPEKAEVKIKKKSELGSLAEGFIEDAGRGLLSYFVNEHLIPFVERTIRSVADRVLRRLGGTIDISDKDRDGTYRKYSRSSSSYERREQRSRDPFGIDRIILRTKSEAERILRGLEDQIYNYRVASVADLFELLGEDCPYTANDYGWTSMSGAKIVMVSEGYQLKLPRVMAID